MSDDNNDIVERLCDAAFHAHPSSQIGEACCEAADEIERLRNRIARLEQALDGMGYLKAINTITVELGPKASGPDDIADALRKAVGR